MIKVPKGKELKPRILSPARLPLRNEGDEEFLRKGKNKLKEFNTKLTL